MSATISISDKTKIDIKIKELYDHSLLQGEESVLEGFYPLFSNKLLHYVLLSGNKLILVPKKQRLGKTEIIPFSSIRNVSFTRANATSRLIYAFLSLTFIPLFYLIFSFFMEYLIVLEGGWLFDGVLWLIVILLLIGALSNFLIYIRGEDFVFIEIPEKSLKLQSTLSPLSLSKQTIQFDIQQGLQQYQGKNITLHEFYTYLKGRR